MKQELIDMLTRADYAPVFLDAVKTGHVLPGSESTVLIKCKQYERVSRPDDLSIERALLALKAKIEYYQNIKIE